MITNQDPVRYFRSIFRFELQSIIFATTFTVFVCAENLDLGPLYFASAMLEISFDPDTADGNQV